MQMRLVASMLKKMPRPWLIWLLYAVVGGSVRLVGNHHVFQYYRKVWSSKILNPQHTALASARIDVMVKRKSFFGLLDFLGSKLFKQIIHLWHPYQLRNNQQREAAQSAESVPGGQILPWLPPAPRSTKSACLPCVGRRWWRGRNAECDNDETDQYLCDGPHLAPALHITSVLLSTATIACN